MQWPIESQFFHWFPVLLVSLQSFQGLKLVSQLPSCSKIFRTLARSKYLYIFSLSFIFSLWSPERKKSSQRQVLFALLIKLYLLYWQAFGYPIVSQNPKRIIILIMITCNFFQFMRLANLNSNRSPAALKSSMEWCKIIRNSGWFWVIY